MKIKYIKRGILSGIFSILFLLYSFEYKETNMGILYGLFSTINITITFYYLIK